MFPTGPHVALTLLDVSARVQPSPWVDVATSSTSACTTVTAAIAVAALIPASVEDAFVVRASTQ